MTRAMLAGTALLVALPLAFVQAQDHDTGIEYDSASEPTTEEFLVRLNRDLFERYVLHHDTELYAHTALDDYVLVASIGAIETREEVLATAGNLDIRALTVTNNEFRHHGTTAVLVGTLDMEGTILGHDVSGQRRYLSVFIEQDGQWRLMARSLSPIVDPRELYGEPE